ncbi:MAG: hypothetical protein LC804_12540 [Acidobacteria bacterium]|nr:hypothetical protein [Acidobacteriota bacterium]
MWTPATVGGRDDGGFAAMPGATQKLVPEQLLITRINSADRTMLMTMDPRQPNRFEKKKNT